MQDVSSIVKGHIVEGFINADHLEDEQLIETLNDDVKIRINKYHSAHEVSVSVYALLMHHNFTYSLL